MSILAWLFLGLVAGFVANKLVLGAGQGIVRDVLLGIVGALVGGAAFAYTGHRGITGLDLWSLFVSILGAALLLILYHAFASPQTTTPKK